MTVPPTIDVNVLIMQHKFEAHRNRHYSPDSSVHRITVRRKKVLEDALLYFKKGIPQDKQLKVTFVGEPAIDDGRPLREFFHLLIPVIRRSSLLLLGSDNAKSPTDNIIEFEKKTSMLDKFLQHQLLLVVQVHHSCPRRLWTTCSLVWIRSKQLPMMWVTNQSRIH